MGILSHDMCLLQAFFVFSSSFLEILYEIVCAFVILYIIYRSFYQIIYVWLRLFLQEKRCDLRDVDVKIIENEVALLCRRANIVLPSDVSEKMKKMQKEESSPIAQAILEELLENAALAEKNGVPICQDTGMAVVRILLGQEVHFTGGDVVEAIHRGVRKGYQEGYLRASVVADPIIRENTKDNTPAVILWDMVPGNKVDITVAPKGFGSENMSSLTMLSPSQGIEGIKEAVISTVKKAGPNPCPPIVLGIGLGGTMDMAAKLSKLALMRPLEEQSELSHIRDLEQELLEEINRLDIGPSGLGGRTTALSVRILTYPTHIAGLPVAVNVSCHVTRHAHICL